MGRHIPVYIECIYLVGLSYAVAITFAVVSINPIRPAMGLKAMYLTPVISFAAIITVYLWSDINSQYLGKRYLLIAPVANLVFATLLIIASTYTVDKRIGFNGFIWKANSEYNKYSERFRQGELILTGKNKKVFRMIATFNQPVITVERASGISVVDFSPKALCVKRLRKNPIHLNYEDCLN